MANFQASGSASLAIGQANLNVSGNASANLASGSGSASINLGNGAGAISASLSNLSPLPQAGYNPNPAAALAMVVGSIGALASVAVGRRPPTAALMVPLTLGLRGYLNANSGGSPLSLSSGLPSINQQTAGAIGNLIKAALGPQASHTLGQHMATASNQITAGVNAGAIPANSHVAMVGQALNRISQVL